MILKARIAATIAWRKLRSLSLHIPIELANNVGVYTYMQNDFVNAERYITMAMSAYEKDETSDNKYWRTLYYNLARCKEEAMLIAAKAPQTDNTVDMKELIASIRKSYDQCLSHGADENASMRLALLLQREGQSAEGLAMIRAISTRNPQNPVPLYLLAEALNIDRQFEASRDTLKKARDLKEGETYALIALGNSVLSPIFKAKDEKVLSFYSLENRQV